MRFSYVNLDSQANADKASCKALVSTLEASLAKDSEDEVMFFLTAMSNDINGNRRKQVISLLIDICNSHVLSN
jgi:hypothetical protein